MNRLQRDKKAPGVKPYYQYCDPPATPIEDPANSGGLTPSGVCR